MFGFPKFTRPIASAFNSTTEETGQYTIPYPLTEEGTPYINKSENIYYVYLKTKYQLTSLYVKPFQILK